MADRRRVHGPGGSLCLPSYDDDVDVALSSRDRELENIRAVYLKTGVTPSASGSAYLEIEPTRRTGSGGMKLTCTVHGPRSLPRSAPFSPHMVLSTHVKYAPFATNQRKGYVRDSSERDLSIHLETALRGAMIADRWPKSGVDVVVTIIEGEIASRATADPGLEAVNTMNILSGCINVAAAAIADAGIDCVDTISGGVAALMVDNDATTVVIDPVPSDHDSILAACCVAYLPARDEITNLWLKGRLPSGDNNAHQRLVAWAVQASKASRQATAVALRKGPPGMQ
ncbi:3' exoribonuclease family protein [Hirsutella rhossiliensis]|uniref:3' exoribonuclease family protein n=1 Tax=Hirsutella rhossiliensis TaxID=111463 RepID=A0A9P8MRY9_9HYPO|nr:3' exoribonuclease family protein [Hirsutella rhossiliensis]KAH0960332.1 3' exoribonuclease family protein [Hirsutella rhossiliensis]